MLIGLMRTAFVARVLDNAKASHAKASVVSAIEKIIVYARSRTSADTANLTGRTQKESLLVSYSCKQASEPVVQALGMQRHRDALFDAIFERTISAGSHGISAR